MKSKLLLLIVLLVLLASVGGGIVWLKDTQEIEKEAPEFDMLEFAPEVEEVLAKRMRLIVKLLEDPVIVEAVRAANREHQDITLQEILLVDAKWQTTPGIDEFINQFLTNEVALKLIEFQEEYPGFSEIFVTDEKGLNVGQTNKTTDYYQADEAWWIGGYQSGAGKRFHGSIEFDESAQAEAISLYAPVIDPETRRAIGVAKAVLSIASIKFEL